MSIWTLPCRFSSKEKAKYMLRYMLGNSFVHYFTRTYDGHERVAQELRHDSVDFDVMLLREHCRAQGARIGTYRTPARYWQRQTEAESRSLEKHPHNPTQGNAEVCADCHYLAYNSIHKLIKEAS